MILAGGQIVYNSGGKAGVRFAMGTLGLILRAIATPCLILGLLTIGVGFMAAFSWLGFVLFWVGAALFVVGTTIQVALLVRWLLAR